MNQEATVKFEHYLNEDIYHVFSEQERSVNLLTTCSSERSTVMRTPPLLFLDTQEDGLANVLKDLPFSDLERPLSAELKEVMLPSLD